VCAEPSVMNGGSVWGALEGQVGTVNRFSSLQDLGPLSPPSPAPDWGGVAGVDLGGGGAAAWRRAGSARAGRAAARGGCRGAWRVDTRRFDATRSHSASPPTARADGHGPRARGRPAEEIRCRAIQMLLRVKIGLLAPAAALVWPASAMVGGVHADPFTRSSGMGSQWRARRNTPFLGALGPAVDAGLRRPRGQIRARPE